MTYSYLDPVMQNRVAWNAGKTIGTKRPVTQKQICAIGFSTSSSSATLPVAIRVAEDNLSVSPPLTSTVLPLGAAIGMDGLTKYVAMLALFAAHAFGIDLTLADYIIIAAKTTIVAIGVAPVPSGSLFMLAAVLAAIGIRP
ncbi:dicarboxylate/amino acid:cation symporter [Sphingomonas aestuarii]